jgi:hypothetical protein
MFNTSLIKRSVALGVTIGVAGLPTAAQARLDLNPPLRDSWQAVSAPVSLPVTQPSAGSGSGFEWGDAAIGAAGAIALLAAGAGSAGALRRRRSPGAA